MDEASKKLSEILSSSEGLDSIMSVVKSLTGSPAAPPEDGQDSSVTSAPSQSPSLPISIPEGFDLSALSKLDPRFASAAMGILRDLTADDEKTKLLYALKPHLPGDKRGKVDKAAQILRISKSIRTLLNSRGGASNNV